MAEHGIRAKEAVRTHSLQSLEIAPSESVPNSLAFCFVHLCLYRVCFHRDVNLGLSSRCIELDFVVSREGSPIRVSLVFSCPSIIETR